MKLKRKTGFFLSLSFCLIGKRAGKVFLQKNISFCLCLVSKKHEETKRKRILWLFGCLVVERMGFFGSGTMENVIFEGFYFCFYLCFSATKQGIGYDRFFFFSSYTAERT